jgi:phage baseplate assembly protein W
MSTLNLSDNSDITKDSQIVSRVKSYSDLDLRFKPHPSYGDIVPIKDIAAIQSSIRNILLTNYNEKPFEPDFGSNITQFLFEPSNPITISLMVGEIKRSIKNHEPRVVVRDVTVTDDSDLNALSISVTVLIINSQQIVDISLYLERTR